MSLKDLKLNENQTTIDDDSRSVKYRCNTIIQLWIQKIANK